MIARSIGASGSIAIHALLLLAFVAVFPKPQPVPVPVGAPEPKQEDHNFQLLPSADREGRSLECPKFYAGIGLVASWTDDRVMDIAPGGPADVAGIRVGDIFLSNSVFQRDLYPIGKVIPMSVQRDGQRIDMQVRIGRICYRENA